MSAKIIAIDYDGTIALDSFPHAGTPNWPVINRAKEEQMNGAILILWTCRTGKDLEVALEACTSWGLHFTAVNENTLERQKYWGNNPRKVYADEYWDDHAVTIETAKWEHWTGGLLRCSKCGYEYLDYLECTNYCGNCGTRMITED